MNSYGNWLDEIGDRLESEGTAPGRIFEFHQRLVPDLLPTGIVETVTSLAEGQKPTSPKQIKRVIVRMSNGVELSMPGHRPIVVANFLKLNLL